MNRKLLAAAAATASLGAAALLLDRALGAAAIPSDRAHRPNLSVRRGSDEFSYLFETNSRGLRHGELVVPKPEGERRVLMLGSSFVQGAGVEGSLTIPALLEARWGLAVVNGGRAGTGPVIFRDLLLDVGLAYEPDAVLVAVFARDVAGTPERESLLRRWGRALVPNVVRLAGNRRNARADAEHKTTTVGPDYWTTSLDLTGSGERRWRTMAGALDDIAAICRERAIALGVTFIPAGVQFEAEEHRRGSPWDGAVLRPDWLAGESALQRRLRAWARQRRLPYHDLTEQLRRAPRTGLRWKRDGHFTAKGNAFVAARIDAWVRADAVLPFKLRERSP